LSPDRPAQAKDEQERRELTLSHWDLPTHGRPARSRRLTACRNAPLGGETEGYNVSTIIDFEPHRFESAAAHYVEGRPRYADRLIKRVSGALGFDGTQRVLDVGTGPGQLAIAFAPHVRDAVGVDPEPEMLRIAGEEARRAGVRLTLLEGSSYTLSDDLGPFDLAVFGRSFHCEPARAD
jgi:SAM-dependent methyltransferase